MCCLFLHLAQHVLFSKYLRDLEKHELKTLGRLLGLSDSTVRERYDGFTHSEYLESIVDAWFMKKDNVAEIGTDTVNHPLFELRTSLFYILYSVS